VPPDGSWGAFLADKTESEDPAEFREELIIVRITRLESQVSSGVERDSALAGAAAAQHQSHDWHVQPVVKDRTVVRLSGTFRSGRNRLVRARYRVLDTCRIGRSPCGVRLLQQTFQTYREQLVAVNRFPAEILDAGEESGAG